MSKPISKPKLVQVARPAPPLLSAAEYMRLNSPQTRKGQWGQFSTSSKTRRAYESNDKFAERAKLS